MNIELSVRIRHSEECALSSDKSIFCQFQVGSCQELAGIDTLCKNSNVMVVSENFFFQVVPWTKILTEHKK